MESVERWWKVSNLETVPTRKYPIPGLPYLTLPILPYPTLPDLLDYHHPLYSLSLSVSLPLSSTYLDNLHIHPHTLTPSPSSHTHIRAHLANITMSQAGSVQERCVPPILVLRARNAALSAAPSTTPCRLPPGLYTRDPHVRIWRHHRGLARDELYKPSSSSLHVAMLSARAIHCRSPSLGGARSTRDSCQLC